MPGEKIAVVTGASAGVGRATARAFAARGYDVALIARGRDGLEAAAQEVRALGRRALVAPCDVADAAGLESAAGRIERELGPIDVWVNCAMTVVFSEFWHIRPDEYKRVTEVTYLGYVYGTMTALRRMLARDRGVVVQVGSALAYRGIPLQSAYCGAKHAIQGFSESVRCELLHVGSRVKITMPQMPALNTPQFSWSKAKLGRKPQPVPPIYQPEVAARAIVWSAEHPRRREPSVGLSTALVIALNKIAAGAGDWYLGKTGYDSQQYDGGVEPDRPNNLWEPVPGDFGAHGDFDARAHGRSPQWWLQEHWKGTAAGVLLAGAGLVVAGLRRNPLAAIA